MADHYYNEFNTDAAHWLQNLMDAGHIPKGDIDTRSIEDVTPNDVAHYTQCHWFAGIGGWPLALRLAGWPDSRPIWTGSCPCQPFSSAGKGGGFDDQRHLWPAWLHLIRQRRPAIIIGEQVASPDALRWWDLVSADLEGSHYAAAAADLCSAGIGAAHIRQRLYWMAHAEHNAGSRRSADKPAESHGASRQRPHAESGRCGNTDRMADTERHTDRSQAAATDHQQPQGDRSTDRLGGRGGAFGGLSDANQRTGRQGHPDAGRRDTGSDAQPWRGPGSGGEFGGVGQSDITGPQPRQSATQAAGYGRATESAGADDCGVGDSQQQGLEGHAGDGDHRHQSGRQYTHAIGPVAEPSDATVWLPCLDGKSRPASAEPGSFPLAYGIPRDLGRVQPELAGMGRSAGRNRRIRLHGYGNAIDPRVAAEFVSVVMELAA